MAPEVRQLVVRLINEVFHEFKTRLRNWKKDFPDQDSLDSAKRAYVRLLVKYRIGDERVIRDACERVCTDLRWYQPPDDFVAVCLDIMGERLDLPSVGASLQQALRHSNHGGVRHEAVHFTLQRMGTDQVAKLRTDNQEAAERRWTTHWRETIRHLACGGQILLIEPPKPKDEREEKPPLPREQNKAHLKQLIQELAL